MSEKQLTKSRDDCTMSNDDMIRLLEEELSSYDKAAAAGGNADTTAARCSSSSSSYDDDRVRGSPRDSSSGIQKSFWPQSSGNSGGNSGGSNVSSSPCSIRAQRSSDSSSESTGNGGVISGTWPGMIPIDPRLTLGARSAFPAYGGGASPLGGLSPPEASGSSMGGGLHLPASVPVGFGVMEFVRQIAASTDEALTDAKTTGDLDRIMAERVPESDMSEWNYPLCPTNRTNAEMDWVRLSMWPRMPLLAHAGDLLVMGSRLGRPVSRQELLAKFVCGWSRHVSNWALEGNCVGRMGMWELMVEACREDLIHDRCVPLSLEGHVPAPYYFDAATNCLQVGRPEVSEELDERSERSGDDSAPLTDEAEVKAEQAGGGEQLAFGK